MKKKCAFTIVAKNYIGLGQILGKSIQIYNEDIDFFIVVSDEFSEPNPSLSANVIIGKEVLGIKPQKWVDMSFKYDLTEFCTSIKPLGFRYFFDKGYDNVIYFDGLNWNLMDPTFASTSANKTAYKPDEKIYSSKFVY